MVSIPKSKKGCKEFIVYLKPETRDKLVESLKDVGWTRHEFMELMIDLWLKEWEASVK